MPGLPLLTNEWLVLNCIDADDSSFHHHFYHFGMYLICPNEAGRWYN
jgi:hypothetical protein